MRYIISDTHLGHGNLIEYVGRPFDSVEEMNKAIVNNWNSTVSEEDTVIHLGDVRHHPSPLDEKQWLDKLNGKILLIQGNHDAVGSNFPYNTVQTCTMKHGKYTFYLEHRPINELEGWQLHGHLHNNNMRDYPFINPERKTVNVSCELLEYTPLPMDSLVFYLRQKKRYSTVKEAMEDVGL